MSQQVIAVNQVSKSYRPRSGRKSAAVHALRDVSLQVGLGQTTAVVGESGSGKSTLARLLLGLEMPDSGTVNVLGQDWAQLKTRQRRAHRKSVQLIMQDPSSALAPRMRNEAILAEPLLVHSNMGRANRQQRIREVLASVGLAPDVLSRYPHELSGGQRQRLAIARALVTEPAVIVADEPVASLDASVQATIINLLWELTRDGITLVLISHDMSVVRQIADQVVVLRQGKVTEQGQAAEVFARPAAEYTQELIAASK